MYCASSLSLATLEYFVHLDPADLPDDLVSIRVEIPSSAAIERLPAKALPRDWRAYPPGTGTKDIGTEWATSSRAVALLVPSAVTPIEDNVILNPRHPDMRRIRVATPEPFAFDPRMLGG